MPDSRHDSKEDRMYDPEIDLPFIRDKLKAEFQTELAEKDRKIAELEEQVRELTTAISEGAEQHELIEGEECADEDISEDRKKDTLIDMLPYKGPDPVDLSDNPIKPPLEPDYLEQLLERTRTELNKCLSDDNDATEKSDQVVSWARKYGTKVRGDLLKRLTYIGVKESEAIPVVIDLVGRETFVDQMFKDFLRTAQEIDDKLAEYRTLAQTIADREAELNGILQEAGKVVQAKQAVEQREAEAESLEKLLAQKDADISERAARIAAERDALDKEKSILQSDILSFRSYTKVFEGFAASMRDMFYIKHASMKGRVANIKNEHSEMFGIKGVALIASAPYLNKIGKGLTEQDFSDGMSEDEVRHLKKRLTDKDVRGYSQPIICSDDKLGIYLIGPIVKEADNQNHNIPIAHFCITGIPPNPASAIGTGTDDGKAIINKTYAHVVLETYQSVRDEVILTYEGLHFLGPHLNYLLERLNRLVPEESGQQTPKE